MGSDIREGLAAVVDETIERVGPRLVVATPLGVGKPIHLLNAFYDRARRNKKIQLEIVTALTLAAPEQKNELARRLAGPISRRLSGDGPDATWDTDRRRGKLPRNVRIREFYLPPGAELSVPPAQQEYVSANYHHVGDVIADMGVNVIAQLVSPVREGTVSLGTNPDLSVRLAERLWGRRASGEQNFVVGVTSSHMPYLYGDSVLGVDVFDRLVEVEDSPLFGMPNPRVDERDAAIGVLAAGLVKDGGTIQLGIGSLGDAVAAALRLRHGDPNAYGRLLDDLARDGDRQVIDRIGGEDPFRVGLYASSEMVSDGLFALLEEGIIRRRVQEDAATQQLADELASDGRPSMALLAALAERGVIEDPLQAADVERLKTLGVMDGEVRLVGGMLELGETRTDSRIGDHLEQMLGTRLSGVAMHAAFAIGSPDFYRRLREMDDDLRAGIRMTDVGFTNSLLGDLPLKLAQRRHGRFINITMQMTLLGAAASDTLSDGRVVSGVGGQHDFVTMGHDLPGGRSIILGRATRTSHDREVSNVVWAHGHPTIPRHLRDIVVTEYGIADLRGKTDSEVIAAMIEIADARFQDALVSEAKAGRKLPKSYRVPDAARSNLPERYLGSPGRTGVKLEPFPFGTVVTPVEVELAQGLGSLQKAGANPRTWPSWPAIRRAMSAPPAEAGPHLERMGLSNPRGMKERIMAAAVVAGLTEIGVVGAEES